MTQTLALSEDGYLLGKNVHASKIKDIVDISTLNLKNEIKDLDAALAMLKEVSGTRQPSGVAEIHYLQKLYKYDSVKDGDVVVWYDDIGILSGSAGYILLREGYVHNSVMVWRS